MGKPTSTIAGFFDIPPRFMRSVQLERDFADPTALENYVVTPHVRDAFTRIVDGLRSNSGRRAWRITGDYGVGKSSFALALAHALEGLSAPEGLPGRRAKTPTLWPVLLTGSREPLLPAIAAGIAQSMRQRYGLDKRRKTLAALAEQAEAARKAGDATSILSLLDAVRNYAAEDSAGILLVIDELGKFLEFAAQNPDHEDVFVLQRLAEIAARSADKPFLVLGLLHQGFQAYAERLPSVTRNEWEKVAGRFEEFVFSQPLAHAAALIAGSLNVNHSALPSPVKSAAHEVSTAAHNSGWLSNAGADPIDAKTLYPLHPMVIPALIRFFGRFGQNERSLFGFLLSTEPFGVQDYAAREPDTDTWYGLADFYDYIRASFGHRLAGASYRNHWLRILATIDSAADILTLELRILKAVAVLNLIDADDLLPTDAVLRALFAPMPAREITTAIAALKKSGVLFQRGRAYRLWPNGSVGLENAIEAAARDIGPVESVAHGLEVFLDREPVLARRHYVESGTLRYFELRYAPATSLADALKKPINADGLVVVALADTENERHDALKAAASPKFADQPNIVVGVAQPLLSLAPELKDVRCWQWVVDHTPELADDAYAAAEATRQLTNAKRALMARLQSILGLRAGTAKGVEWFVGGEKVAPPARSGLSGLLSNICDQMFASAPLIANELINRSTLSSAAAAARMRLIEGIFSASDKPLLGLDSDKSPPEKSMYLSILHKGGVHVQQGDRFALVEPKQHDPLRLRPSIGRLVEMIEGAKGGRVSAADLIGSLSRAPYGVRAGVSPLLLAVVLCTRSHEMAVYEQGTFLHRFGAADFMRLTKSPADFEIQHCRIAGVRLEVFRELSLAFAKETTCRRPELLDVVRPLCQFAAQLPDYTRKTTSLGKVAIAVRDALVVAREPATMLFQHLPQACGVEPFEADQDSDGQRSKQFIEILHGAVGELRAAYPELLSRIIGNVAAALGGSKNNFDRAALASRAARVCLSAKEPKLRTFAMRLRDPGLTDEAWAEALASFIVAKPPSKWISADEARFTDEVGALAELFHKVEAAAFHGDAAAPSSDAIRLNLTRADGVDLFRIVDPTAGDEETAGDVETVSNTLPEGKAQRLRVLAQLLWRELQTPDEDANLTAPTKVRQQQ